ncbi:hypothetical protein EYS42_09185 [Aquabacterium lacunae]|uniref:Uncharacterized protein n=1 Tax=Aquabacterium lacunae TaxID=2528630 RepID=A0A4V2JFQ1_9BURK|nr:PhaM family polyhydroxyalkanoate granule multifunctional regulatory protein [Aquabacterium lacunae]TBO31398.1 hypothetical protein EYS42_09185 [Aquabacterium lacunae]
MPSRPESPDPSRSAMGAEGAYAGLNFFQDWMKAASSALPHLTGASRTGGSAWTLPTLDPEELDKRIQDLKTVQFWLEQNARMIGMTIQTLEVQRMTLNTLRSMNMPLDAVRDTLKASTPAWERPTAAPGPQEACTQPPEATEAADTSIAGEPGTATNPLHWWNTLTTQFTHLAQQAVQAGQDAVAAATPPMPGSEAASSAGRASRKAAPARNDRKAAAPGATTKPSPARKRSTSGKGN